MRCRVLMSDMRFGAEILCLHIPPLGAILELKMRFIHDLTFAHDGGRRSVNGDTDVGHVLHDRLLRVLFLRRTYDSRARIRLCRVVVKGVIRQL